MTRRYDEGEVAEILRRAAEPRARHALAPIDSATGLTLAEVKGIAAEAGIDVGRVDEAARSLARPARRSRLDVFVGTPTNVRYEAVVGADLDEADRAELVRMIRASLDREGVVGGRGRTVEWMDTDGLGGRHVTIAPTAEGTRVEVTGRFSDAAAGAAGVTGVTAAVGAMGVALLAGPATGAALVLAPITVGAMLLVPRLTLGRVVRRETDRLSSLADRLRDAIAARRPARPTETERETEIDELSGGDGP